MKGRIISLHDTYGFIKSDEGLHYYFSSTATVGRTEFSMLERGSEVEFSAKMFRAGWGALFVRLCHKPPFVWEEGVTYVERASKRLRHWRKGDPSTLEPHHRVLTSAVFVTEYFSVMEDARDFFLNEAKSAGANFAGDIEIETSVRLTLGYASTYYRYRGVVGIILKPKKAQTPKEARSLTRVYQAIIEKRLELFEAFEDRHQLVSEPVIRHDFVKESLVA
jgi:cold shock CspA family protein